jgi:heme o synthase
MQSAAIKIEKTRFADYWDLTKPGITFLVVITALAAAYLASDSSPNLLMLFHAVSGIALISSGGGALNHYLERNRDTLMNRTRNRPIPSGRLHPIEALVLGITLSVTGIIYLAVAGNMLTSILGALTLFLYIGIYTPLKSKSPHSTLVGAIPGAMPPVLGWTAITGTISVEALVLFAIVFFWQMPHFLGIAWMYRKDYEKGGFRILPVVEPDGKSTMRMSLMYCIGLLPVSLLPAALNLAGTIYFAGAIVCGIGFLYFAVKTLIEISNHNARNLVLASVLYLPVIMALLIFDAIG